jgi:hypothetical protein
MFNRLSMALSRTRLAIGIMALTYLTSLTAGVLMTHQGNEFALSYRDSLVSKAYRADPAAQANRAGAHLKAAAIDFSRNLGLVAIPETIGGLTLVMPIGMSLYRGWIGGIVSVDRRHHSRARMIPVASPATQCTVDPTACFHRGRVKRSCVPGAGSLSDMT